MPELFRPRPVQEFLAPHGRGGGNGRLPQQPQLTKRERREEVRSQRAQDRQDERIRKGRIRVLKWAGGAVLTGVGLYAAAQSAPGRALIEFAVGEEEFSGEVEQTRVLLDKWNKEVGEDPRKLEAYIPRVGKLAVAYFCNEMGTLFPDKKEYYSKADFEKKLNIVSERTFIENASDCATNVSAKSPGYTRREGRVFFSPEVVNRMARFKTEKIKSSFGLLMHELIHSGSKRVVHNPGIAIEGIPQPVVKRHGFVQLIEDKAASQSYGKECFRMFNDGLDEAVVEHNASLLANKVGAPNIETGPTYRTLVETYSQQIYPLFSNDTNAPLRYHQDSDFEGFVSAIGEKLSGTKDQNNFRIGAAFVRRIRPSI